ncbi:ricin B lectin domain-containing protein [Choanephora cucurbitarum]|nr:ricin B lectin domain-containing protein [Choanephora cucurbitarum]
MTAGIPNGPFYIVSEFNGRVLDVEGASTKDKAEICAYTKKHGSEAANQLWEYRDGALVNVHSGKVLDIKHHKVKSDARLIQNEKATSNNDEIEKQRWLIDPEGYIHIFSDPNLVIDIRGAEDKDGAEIILYEKRGGNASSNQRWRLEPARQ